MWTPRALSEERERQVYWWWGGQATSPSPITSHCREGTTGAQPTTRSSSSPGPGRARPQVEDKGPAQGCPLSPMGDSVPRDLRTTLVFLHMQKMERMERWVFLHPFLLLNSTQFRYPPVCRPLKCRGRINYSQYPSVYSLVTDHRQCPHTCLTRLQIQQCLVD